MKPLLSFIKDSWLDLTAPVYKLEIRYTDHPDNLKDPKYKPKPPWLWCYKILRNQTEERKKIIVWMLNPDGIRLPSDDDYGKYVDLTHRSTEVKCWEWSEGYQQWSNIDTEKVLKLLEMVREQVPQELLFHECELLRGTIARLLKGE